MQHNGFPSREKVKWIKEDYPPGTRIRLHDMEDDPCAVPSGTMGTVVAVDDAGQLLMHWDNGRSLSLIPGVDRFAVVSRPQQPQEQPKMTL